MVDTELQFVCEELKQIRETISSYENRYEELKQIRETIENRVENLEYELWIKVKPMSEEIDRLNSLVNPWSEDCKPVADCNEADYNE